MQKKWRTPRLRYPRRKGGPISNILEIVETAGLAAEINEISKKVSMDTGNGGSGESELEAEPMDVEEDEVYARRYDEDMGASAARSRTKGSRRKWRTLTGSSWGDQRNRRRIVKISCGIHG
jgi:hypothetical protein